MGEGRVVPEAGSPGHITSPSASGSLPTGWEPYSLPGFWQGSEVKECEVSEVRLTFISKRPELTALWVTTQTPTQESSLRALTLWTRKCGFATD